MKRFNTTGNCVSHLNYMVDTSEKINKILLMIEYGDYFVMNRPRQYGKTTTLSILRKELLTKDDYVPINMSFEVISDQFFETEKDFCYMILSTISENKVIIDKGYSDLVSSKIHQTTNFSELSKSITEIIKAINKKVVLMIDEIDKGKIYEHFIKFLGILRGKFLSARVGDDVTFHSVILAGLNDIKNLKSMIRTDSSAQLNSPWNIAADFEIDMSFSSNEIETMLIDYAKTTNNSMNTKEISEYLHYWTSGYPFLVSKLCRTIDEDIKPSIEWEFYHVDEAVRMLLSSSNTLFEVISKYIENNNDFYDLINKVVFGHEIYEFDTDVPIIHLGNMYGIIKRTDSDKIKIHNRIFEEKLTQYLIAKNQFKIDGYIIEYEPSQFIKSDGKLDFDLVMYKFQEMIKENYTQKMFEKYAEIDLRLLFFAFLKQIINGHGFYFKEAQISEEKKLDVVVVFGKEKFIVELKLWRGDSYHERGLKQLKKYIELESLDKGYMLIMSKNKEKEFITKSEDNIKMFWV